MNPGGTMNRKELQLCCMCRRGVMAGRRITFRRITIERFAIDQNAVQRRDGLENMMGGGVFGAAIAEVMGTDEDLAKSVGKKTLFICDDCAESQSISVIEIDDLEPQPTSGT